MAEYTGSFAGYGGSVGDIFRGAHNSCFYFRGSKIISGRGTHQPPGALNPRATPPGPFYESKMQHCGAVRVGVSAQKRARVARHQGLREGAVRGVSNREGRRRGGLSGTGLRKGGKRNKYGARIIYGAVQWLQLRHYLPWTCWDAGCLAGVKGHRVKIPARVHNMRGIYGR